MKSIKHITRKYIAILFLLSSINTYSQAHFLGSWLGSTKEETLGLISKTRTGDGGIPLNSLQLYEIKDEKIILTYYISQEDFDIGAKATFYFKNEIAYKVEIACRSNQFTGNQILDFYYRNLHNAFFEEKSKELGTAKMKYIDGTIREFKHTSKYGDYGSGYIEDFWIDENGKHPISYGDYASFSKIMVFSKPGRLIKLDYNYGGVHKQDYYTYTYNKTGYTPPEGLSKRKKKKFIENRERNKKKNWTNINIPLGTQKLVMIIEVSYS